MRCANGSGEIPAHRAREAANRLRVNGLFHDLRGSEEICGLERIGPAIKEVPSNVPDSEKVALGIEANVKRTVDVLQSTSALTEYINDGRLHIAGGVYELESGKVRLSSTSL